MNRTWSLFYVSAHELDRTVFVAYGWGDFSEQLVGKPAAAPPAGQGRSAGRRRVAMAPGGPEKRTRRRESPWPYSLVAPRVPKSQRCCCNEAE